jgi:hypothetical protein
MVLTKQVYHIGEGPTQYVFGFFGKEILIGISKHTFYVRKASLGEGGFEITTKPLFSLRNGYKKSLKFGKYYFRKL